ncbi:MAG: ribosomal protein S18-alanine N-acetyltransferase [Candidatus Acidiferrales bacterium]
MSAAAIRFLESRDIPTILRIQAASREASQWPHSSYENLGRVGQQAWVAEHEGPVFGFLVVHALVDEIEILNLAVDPNVRRKGIGRALLREVLSWGAQRGIKRVFLEVRVSNAAARQFYEAHGFASAGIRAHYYRDPVEDALLLACSLDRKR